MTRYQVVITSTALAAIQDHARYIAQERHAPKGAQRWLNSVWRAIAKLEAFPRRATLAKESEFLPYEVRRVVVHSHLILVTIDDERSIVYVVGIRHGHSLPRPDELPAQLSDLEPHEE